MRTLPSLLLLLLSACAVRAEDAPPVLLISLDTLRADRVGGELTPNLDAFAREAVVFESAYAQANETLFSHASLFTSRYPSELGRLSYGFHLPEQVPTLAEILSSYGYRTGAAVAGGQLSPGQGLERGFDQWEVPADWGSLYHTVPAALSWLDALDDGAPWLLLVHGYDAHHRYLKPPPFGLLETAPGYAGPGVDAVVDPTGTARIFGGWLHAGQQLGELFDFRDARLLGPGFQRRLRAAVRRPDSLALPLGARAEDHIRGVYDGAVRYADALFGVLMAELERRGVLDRALVVVFSDHGESLGERGVYNHRYSLSDEDLHVPLMIRPPGGTPGRRVAEPVALLDVSPTVLDWIGAELPAGVRGRSLAPALRGEPADAGRTIFSEGVFRMIAARDAVHRLIFSGVGADSPFLADLLEVYPLGGPGVATDAEPGEAAELLARLAAWRGALPPPPAPAAADPALREALRRHGYWGLE